jgi:REP element-mobilizing transposase RayT
MVFGNGRHHRRSIRLKGYDYAQAGAYFVTVCTKDRACLFGDVVDGEMRSNEFGQIAEWTWHDLPNHVPAIVLDTFVIMPNHVHGIILICERDDLNVGAGSEPAPTEPACTTIGKHHGLPEIIRQFKTFSAKRINKIRETPGLPVWQRNYYEHIIRNEESLHRIRQYIVGNPARWEEDRENPQAIGAVRERPLPEPEGLWLA